MDSKSKRKASSPQRSGDGSADDPPAKRRKLPSDFPSLMEGETPESTTAHGLNFLAAIRRTADKSRRIVSGYFEKLLPKDGNEAYYNKVPMPISLRVIERKLYRQEFANLSELESWLKRMVTNAKEYYPKNSQNFEDAEKVRKAASNWFVKFNPAYKKIENYATTPCPIPPHYNVDAELALEDMDSETAATEMGAPPPRPAPDHQPTPETAPEAADRGDEEMLDADADADAEADAPEEAQEEDAKEEDAKEEAEVEDSRASGTRIVLKRRGAAAATARESNTPSTTGNIGSTQYSGVPYQGLTFQKAQEKIIDTLMKRMEEDDDEWPYFEPFINLPDKNLKDYYQLIDNPMSLKKMWRVVQGMQGRGPATGVSLYKSWAALEQDATFLWTNAQYYNEEGSEIYELAGELRDAFYEQLNEAKAVVQEPAQPKIKLRAPSSAQPPLPGPAKPKRITIHVGGGREGSQESPAPHGGPSHSSATPQSLVHNGAARMVHAPVANPVQHPAALPIASSFKREETARQSPAVPPQMNNGYSSREFRPVVQSLNGNGLPNVAGTPIGHTAPLPLPAPVVPPPARRSLLDVKYRPAIVKDPVLPYLSIRTMNEHPDQRFFFNVPPSPELLQQSFTINLGPTQFQPQIVARIPPNLKPQGRPWKFHLLVNNKLQYPEESDPRDPREPQDLVFKTSLHQGVNTIMVTMLAALPGHERMPNGADAVLEKVIILANVAKQ